ncbi:MAG: exosortase A [Porticoccaceae bacterium]
MEITGMDGRRAADASLRQVIWSSLLLLVAFLGLFHETAWTMFSTWLNSETYTHGILILPIVIWLVWRRRTFWQHLSPRPNYLFLIPLAFSGFGWMLGKLAAVQVVQQLALISMLVSAFIAVVGKDISRTLVFPLAFLFFAVPMGEGLVPPLMEYTATVTTFMVKLTGIPVYRDGMFISLPTGNWSVVSACSGIRYLIASVSLGCLFAYLNYSSNRKRLAFMVVSAIVPIVANGLRAYMIVMIGHLSNMQLAVGVDHLIYGWLFFGLVMLVLFVIGSRWRDPDQVPDFDRVAITVSNLPVSSSAALLRGLVLVLMLGGLWPTWVYALDRVQRTWYDSPLLAPMVLQGWTLASEKQWDWFPRSEGDDRRMDQFYQALNAEESADSLQLHVVHYLEQHQGKEVVHANNRLFNKEFRYWRLASLHTRETPIGADSLAVREAIIRGPGRELLVWQWYRVGNYYTADKYMAKVREVMSRLLKGRRDAAIITVAVSINEDTDESQERGSIRLASFVQEMLPALEAALDQGLVTGDRQ